jgi:hypothetical protein
MLVDGPIFWIADDVLSPVCTPGPLLHPLPHHSEVGEEDSQWLQLNADPISSNESRPTHHPQEITTFNVLNVGRQSVGRARFSPKYSKSESHLD